MCTRSASGTKVSSVRVMSTRYLPVFSRRSRKRWAKSSTISFSNSPLGALVPLSMPPWPGSSATSGRGSLLFASGPLARGSSARLSRLSRSIRRKKLSRSVAARSSTRRAGAPSAASMTKAFSMRAGLVRSKTRREPPCMTRPKRNALIRPRPLSPAFGGSWKVTWGISSDDPIGIGERKGVKIDLAARNP